MSDYVTVDFECGHRKDVHRDEYGDGSAWCTPCSAFRCYERCLTCALLDCQCADGPTLGVLGEPPA